MTVYAPAQASEEVKFVPGNFGTMVSGSAIGNAYVDYQLAQDVHAGANCAM